MEFIDLGLSVKWADMNVGAEKIEDFGNYYTFDSLSKLNLNNKEHIPTYEELQELINYCDWKLIGNEFELQGCRIIGPNGNSIYLPAAGMGPSSAGFGGDFWACEEIDSYEAHSLHFRCGETYTEACSRNGTLTVRLVKDIC